jgi:hypothetical protein
MTFGDQINRQTSLRPNNHECTIYCEQSLIACQLLYA